MTGTLHSQIERLWHRAAELAQGAEANRRCLGKAFAELRTLYSDRAADVRRTLGHGIFEDEIRKRGYKPRTVRDWINDYEAALNGEKSSAEKRRTRRAKKIGPSDPLAEFVKLLPFKAAQAAYREAAKALHPDHGGSAVKMQQLNAAWQRVKVYYFVIRDINN